MEHARKSADIAYPTVMRMGVGGAITGAGIAGLVGTIRQLRLQRRLAAQNREAAEQNKSMDNTIVLRLPAEAKLANTPSTAAAGMIAALSGGAGGYALVNALARKAVMRRMQEEEDRARQEFMDKLPGMTTPAKLAGVVGAAMEQCGALKRADSVFGTVDLGLGGLMALSLLASGGTAYATKQYLDAKDEEQRRKFMRPQKITRVMFAQEPSGDPNAKVAHDIARGVVAAHVLVNKGIPLHKVASVVEAAAPGGIDSATLEEWSTALASDKEAQWAPVADMITSALDSNEPLRNRLIEEGMKASPTMRMFGAPGRWAATNVPGLRTLAKNKLYDKIRGGFTPQVPKVASAGIVSASGLTNSLIGSVAAELLAGRGVQAAPQPQQPAAQAAEDPLPEVVAADPGAAQYVQANRDKIQRMLLALRNAGTL